MNNAINMVRQNTIVNSQGRKWELLAAPKKDGAVYRAPALYTGPEIQGSKRVTLTLDPELYLAWLMANNPGG